MSKKRCHKSLDGKHVWTTFFYKKGFIYGSERRCVLCDKVLKKWKAVKSK